MMLLAVIVWKASIINTNHEANMTGFLMEKGKNRYNYACTLLIEAG